MAAIGEVLQKIHDGAIGVPERYNGTLFLGDYKEVLPRGVLGIGKMISEIHAAIHRQNEMRGVDGFLTPDVVKMAVYGYLKGVLERKYGRQF